MPLPVITFTLCLSGPEETQINQPEYVRRLWRLSRASYNTIQYYSLLCCFVVLVQFGNKL